MQISQEDFTKTLHLHKLWLDGDPDGIRADFQGAYMRGANFQGANFYGANLQRAYMQEANFQGANLQRADMRGAYFQGANFQGATLPDGYTWEEYLSEVVPALLTAGGEKLEDVAKGWDCHSLDNCPISIAFGVKSVEKVPLFYRRQAEQFIQFFDAKLIPNPLGS